MKKNAIIFDASKSGHAYEHLSSTYNIRFFCDNNPQKWGTIVKGLKVLSPHELPQYQNDHTVIIADPYYHQVSGQLLKAGIFRFELYDDAYYREKWPSSLKKDQQPQFLGIGAQKSGTTWLHKNLQMHPDLFLPSKKELHYFDREISSGCNYASYLPPSNQLKGEITPAYSVLSYERIQYIHRLLPDIKIILLLRHPVDRAWSMVQMKYNTIQIPITHINPEEINHFISSYSCISRSNYPQILDNWLKVFPKNQLFIGSFNELQSNPTKLLNNIFRFLHVKEETDFSHYPYKQKIFDGHYKEIPATYKTALQSLYEPIIEQCKKMNLPFT